MSSDHRLGAVALALLSCAMLTTGVPARAEEQVPAPLLATHPMDALTPVEITASARILREAGKLGDDVQMVSLSLEENSKGEVRAWTKGQPFGRHAFAVLLANGKVAEARIDLGAQALTAWTPIENRQAALTINEFISASKIVKADDRWRAAMAKRGITNFARHRVLPAGARTGDRPGAGRTPPAQRALCRYVRRGQQSLG